MFNEYHDYVTGVMENRNTYYNDHSSEIMMLFDRANAKMHVKEDAARKKTEKNIRKFRDKLGIVFLRQGEIVRDIPDTFLDDVFENGKWWYYNNNRYSSYNDPKRSANYSPFENKIKLEENALPKTLFHEKIHMDERPQEMRELRRMLFRETPEPVLLEKFKKHDLQSSHDVSEGLAYAMEFYFFHMKNLEKYKISERGKECFTIFQELIKTVPYMALIQFATDIRYDAFQKETDAVALLKNRVRFMQEPNYTKILALEDDFN